ncbi:hypothetical protein QTP88_025038 [Uroleucon formosanum]
MWKFDSLPLIRAAMPRDRFKMLLRFIRFDNVNTRNIRITTDKAAPIRDIWTMLNYNLQKNYKPTENITVDEQLFPYRGHTKFTQYIPSKPAKYGIKIFWACDAANAYPLQGKIYTGKPQDGERQVNVGERTVLDLVATYKGSGRNVTTDNFFTSMHLATTLNSWNMTLVGTVRKNKRFLPPNMQPSKERAINSTNFAFRKDATLCSYVPKKNKSVILLSTMHMTDEQTVTAKPEIIKYYNQTKGGVDTMDKMLSEYTVKRRTNRWPLAFFYNMIDIAALSAYIIYTEHNRRFNSTDRRRRFLKELANQLCMPAIEIRTSIPKVVGNHFTRSAMEMVLGRPIQQVISIPNDLPTRDASGRIQIVGSCQVCRELNHKQRKTRKACSTCSKPVCNEHSINKVICEKYSLIYYIETQDFYADLSANSNLLDRMDTANMPSDHPCYVATRKKEPGLFSDEVDANIITEFCALRAKSYAFNVYTGANNVGGGEKIKAKGIRAHVVKNHMTLEDHRKCLFGEDGVELYKENVSIRSFNHQLMTIKTKKLTYNSYDDKRMVLEDKINTLAHGHYSIEEDDIWLELEEDGGNWNDEEKELMRELLQCIT